MNDDSEEAAESLPDRVAAVDLGSNSFHLLVAQMRHQEPVIVDTLREQVQLASGLNEKGQLEKPAMERALQCLDRFGQRLRNNPGIRVRAVGTNTLRVAKNARDFIEAAEACLGVPVEVISGREEARLIYLGVAHSLSDDSLSRLVMDIGGGSTECILGERFEVIECHSLAMGCVNFSLRFFKNGEIDKDALRRAVLAARLELQTVERRFQDIGWSEAVGSSGTMEAVAQVIQSNGWAESGITREGLKKLRKQLLELGHVKHLDLPGLKAERASVFPGGVAILTALFEAFNLEHIEVSSGAMREGVLYDLLGRIRHEDVRERTIRIFQQRYHVDPGQAARVERTAEELLRQVRKDWNLQGPEHARFLAWAARLHEIGLAVAYVHHERHGAYLVANSDMPGFSRDDQQVLAAILSGHRRKMRMTAFEELPRTKKEWVLRLTLLLRLAVLLNRGRSPHPPPPVELHADRSELTIVFRRGWLEGHSLTHVDLDAEAAYLKNLDGGFKLSVKG